MSDFKGRRFPTELILLCVRCYCKFGVSYRDLARPLRTLDTNQKDRQAGLMRGG